MACKPSARSRSGRRTLLAVAVVIATAAFPFALRPERPFLSREFLIHT